jgi:YD repeat-containing protein
LEGRQVPQLITIAGAPETPAPAENKGDPRYEHRYTYKFDLSGRITEIEDRKNDDSLWETRRFTYDAAGRVATEIIIKNGKPEFAFGFKYDAGGTRIEKESVWYYVNGEKETTVFRYSDIKLDSRGNWTQRRVSQVEGKDAESVMIETRKITYH